MRWKWEAQFQYATVQEALGAGQWMETWRALNYTHIRPSGSVVTISAVIPSTQIEGEPAVNGQIYWTLHMEYGTPEEFGTAQDEVGLALGRGGVFTAYGDCYGDVTNE